MLKERLARVLDGDNIFLILLGYRWLSLVPAAFALVLNPTASSLAFPIFVAALCDNLILSVFHPRLNKLIVQEPHWFGLDLLLVAMLLALTGGAASPYSLYAFSTLLAAAFFFQMEGALWAAGTLSVLYLAALTAVRGWGNAGGEIAGVLTQVVSFYLIALVFGYPSILLKRVRQASGELAAAHAELLQKNVSLERTNRELQSINTLALAMQSSTTDVSDVQERILGTITGELEFERAILALIEPEGKVLHGWLTSRREPRRETSNGLLHTQEIALCPESGLLAQTVLEGKPRYVADAAPPSTNPLFNGHLDLAPYAVLPLVMRDHPVGVLLVDNPDSGAPISQESFSSLASVANHAAIALGSTRLCVERAQRLAVEEERNRIAMEIHDTATQSLFGIVYALNACLKLLPAQPDEVRARLADTLATAQRTMSDLRRSVYDIWSGDLNTSQFGAELRTHMQQLDAPSTLDVQIDICGELTSSSSFVRKNLLRIAEEGLSNVVKHSQATCALVRLESDESGLRLTIEDNGLGFDVSQMDGTRFGLQSVRERARAIGASVVLNSTSSGGTRLEVSLPDAARCVLAQESHAYPDRG